MDVSCVLCESYSYWAAGSASMFSCSLYPPKGKVLRSSMFASTHIRRRVAALTTPRLPPLHGIKVLDLSRILAGPFCSMMLADMGAEVIKIEHVDRGDDTRSWGPPFTPCGTQSAYFLGVNRNKKSVAIDLKHKDGLRIVRELAARCDIVIENFVPGKSKELGFDYETLANINEKLIYASINGYGSSGPKANAMAYDVMISAVGGLMGITGPEGGEPCKVGVAITDVCAGLVAHGAILAALLARYRDGLGQRIETSLLDTQVACLANVASAYLIGGVVTPPLGTAHQSIVPYQTFSCGDGKRIVMGALNDGQFVSLCAALEMPAGFATQEQFKTNPNRVKHRKELVDALSTRMLQRPSTEWIRRLDRHHVPCAPINNIAEVFEDEQVVHNKRVINVEHPTVGILKMVAPPQTFFGTPHVSPMKPPPLLGEHTIEILTELLSYSPVEVSQLEGAGVIRTVQHGR